MRSLVLVGKPGCGLCREMRAVVEAVAPDFGLGLIERDITDDAELERRYVFEIPVLLLDDREVIRTRATREELRACLAQFVPSSTAPSRS